LDERRLADTMATPPAMRRSFRARLALIGSGRRRLLSQGNGRCSQSSYLQEAIGLRVDCPSCDRSAPPSCGATNACRRRCYPSQRPRSSGARCPVLARAQMRLAVDSARKDAQTSICGTRCQPVLQRGAGLFRDFELDRTASLVLDNCRSVSHKTANGDVIDSKADEIATAKLAVDGEIEHRQIAFAALDLKSDTNGPDFFWSERALLSDKTALVPRRMRMIAFRLDFSGHGRALLPTAPTAALSFGKLVVVSQHRRAGGPNPSV
jgi:hypothetical protein